MVEAISPQAPTQSQDAQQQTRSLDERLQRSLSEKKRESETAEAPPRPRKRKAEGGALPSTLTLTLASAVVLSRRGLVPKGRQKPLAQTASRLSVANNTETRRALVTGNVRAETSAAVPLDVAHGAGGEIDKKSRRALIEQDVAGKPDALTQAAGSPAVLASVSLLKPDRPLPARPAWAQPPVETLESSAGPGMTYQFKSWGAGHAVNVQRIVGEDGQIGFLLNPSSDQVAQHLRDHPQMPQEAQLLRDQRDQQQHGHGAQDETPLDEEA